jgi:hypothetical protein
MVCVDLGAMVDTAAALIMGDQKAIQVEARAMNAGDMYPLFAAMLTHKTYVYNATTDLFAACLTLFACGDVFAKLDAISHVLNWAVHMNACGDAQLGHDYRRRS